MGIFITNEHGAGGGAQVRLLTAAGIISVKVVQVDAANDLALLKAEGKFADGLSRNIRQKSRVSGITVSWLVYKNCLLTTMRRLLPAFEIVWCTMLTISVR
jgi:hypothetical protein